jgi:hypothetical protein
VEAQVQYRLRFPPLGTGDGFAFPCDALGRVDLDALPDRVRNDYLYARAMIGREVAAPSVEHGS